MTQVKTAGGRLQQLLRENRSSMASMPTFSACRLIFVLYELLSVRMSVHDPTDPRPAALSVCRHDCRVVMVR